VTTVAAGVQSRLHAVAEQFSGQLSVCARNLTTGEEVALAADSILPTASVIKVPILVELLRSAEADSTSLEDRVGLRQEDLVGGSGILKALSPGLNPTVHDLATLMIVLSDNTATNMVLDVLGGVAAVNATMEQLGFPTIRLHNRVDFELIGDQVRRLGEASTRDLCGLLVGIAMRKIVSAEVSASAEEILEGQQYLDQATRYMLTMPYWRELAQDPVLRVASKTGFFTGTRVDVGIIRFGTGDGFAYAVANDQSVDGTFLPEAEGSVVNGLVGKALVEHWWPPSEGAPPTVRSTYDVV